MLITKIAINNIDLILQIIDMYQLKSSYTQCLNVESKTNAT